MPRFQLLNETKWETRALRILCNAVIKVTGSTKMHRILVRTKTRKFYDYHGRATLCGHRITMFVPPITRKFRKPRYEIADNGSKMIKDWTWEKKPTLFNSRVFAQVLTHEIHHNMGLGHENMVSIGKLDTDYVDGMIVLPKTEKPKVNLVEERSIHAEAMLKRSKTRLKRAKTIRDRWQAKVNYYNKKYGDAK